MNVFKKQYIIIILICALTVQICSFLLPKNAFAEKKVGSDSALISQLPHLDYEMLLSLNNRRKELDLKEANLKKKEEQLVALKEQLESRLLELGKVNAKLEKLLVRKNDLSERSVKHLVKAFESMKPNSAAPLIESMDRDITLAVLAKMKSKNVGKILSKVRPGIAYKISEQIVKMKK